MSALLENIKNDVNQCRKYTYAGKYSEAVSYFNAVI